MIKLKQITARGHLEFLTGIEDVISGKKTINFSLKIDKFLEKNKAVDIDKVYLISKLSESEARIINPRNDKILQLAIHSTTSWVDVDNVHSFVAEVNKSQLKYISNNLLTSDLQINWNINWFGFISYKNNVNAFLGKITISNIDRLDAKVSENDFNDKVWSKISGEERYLVNVPNVDISMFLKAPSEVDEWKEMMQQRADNIVKAMEKFEKAKNSDDFVTIARDLKSIYDHLDVVTCNNKDKLDGLLFNKLFSGTGVNEASKGMMEGIIKIMDGLEKISNQIGHTATLGNPPKPFTFVGNKDAVFTFLFITDLLFNFIGRML